MSIRINVIKAIIMIATQQPIQTETKVVLQAGEGPSS